jgi:segregation and condensation protein A
VAEPAVAEAPAGFEVHQPGYRGDLAGLARALRSGDLAPAALDLRALVNDAIAWFEREAAVDLDRASVALPQIAQVIELKLRLLLPRPPKTDEDEEFDEDAGEALEAIALLSELEDAIAFLRRRRAERAVVVPARTMPPDLPRPRRPTSATAGELATLAAGARGGGYFELAHDRLSLDDALRRLRRALRRGVRGALRALVPTRSWAERTVLFSALLELIREGRATARQEAPYADIEVESARR